MLIVFPAIVGFFWFICFFCIYPISQFRGHRMQRLLRYEGFPGHKCKRVLVALSSFSSSASSSFSSSSPPSFPPSPPAKALANHEEVSIDELHSPVQCREIVDFLTGSRIYFLDFFLAFFGSAIFPLYLWCRPPLGVPPAAPKRLGRHTWGRRTRYRPYPCTTSPPNPFPSHLCGYGLGPHGLSSSGPAHRRTEHCSCVGSISSYLACFLSTDYFRT